VVEDYGRHDILTFASAIAFQVFFAIIPLTLLGLGLLGGFGLEEQWTKEWSDTVRKSVSEPAFAVIDDTVRQVVGGRQLFWMTAGAVIAVWEISGATRAIMSVFGRIYGSERERTFLERIRDSVVLGFAVTVLLLAAAASVIVGDVALGHLGIHSSLVLWLRWPVALALLFAVVALLVAKAPADPHPVQWVTFGAALVVASWVVTSLVLGWYLTRIADYGSIFGALATLIVTLTYLYFASAAFLTGAVLDARVRRRIEGDRSGDGG
ncbi:MAG TPA: YihY/virulence factor BrkB family protein, partial [Solirubrobacteraceae bacterium]|nr:YihY/virulence factor BrkB family protein [Solirubrobacteraceae bacterium]